MSEHSYGFRKGRSAHQAVREAKKYVTEEGRNWVIDLDIRAFFDQIDHDILMRRIAEEVRDKRILKLIGSYLRCGKSGADGKITKTGNKGTPQGGPLSPLLGNIYLDAFDKELETRRLHYIRYADDVTIYVKSERSAHRIMESLIKWLAKHLKLEVNQEKSKVRPPDQGSFLGFRVIYDRIALSEKSIERYKTNVREIWNARWSVTSKERIKRWRQYVIGWWGYFKLGELQGDIRELSSWTRRHMRKLMWQQWHNWKGRRNALIKIGIRGRGLKIAHSSRGAWRIALALNYTLSNKRLESWGMTTPIDLAKAMAEQQRTALT